MNTPPGDAAPQGRDARLQLLAERVNGLCNGDFTSSLRNSGLQDAIDDLVDGLNLLTGLLQRQHEELEAQVMVRTELLQRAHREMEKMALSDPLTGLANRTALLREIERALSAAARGELPPALLLVDLNSFKAVNDTLGHDAGDRVLREVAARIAGIVRDADTVARLGGDEFAILLPAIVPEQAAVVARRVLESLEENIHVDGRDIISSASIGLTVAEAGLAGEDLLIRADTAMYAAKSTGRHNVMAFAPAMLDARQLRMRKAYDLRRSVAEDQLVLHYQPVVEMIDGRTEGVEALIRWNHPEYGLLSPAEFVPLASETGQMVEIGRWVLRTALRQLHTWDATGRLDARFTMRINLSAAELQWLQLPQDIRTALNDVGVDPTRLVLEINERSIATDADLDRFALPGLRALGVGLEIDDVGVSYAALRHLRSLPVDTVKLDSSLIADLDGDIEQLDFLRALLPLITACGTGVVVEGVESRQQADLLLGLGYTRAQGYLFGKPVPADEATALIM